MKNSHETQNLYPAFIITVTGGAKDARFTQRCLNYELSERQFDSPESKDIQNQEFWDKLHEVFSVILQLVKEHAEQMGIDLDGIDYQETEKEEKQTNEKAQSHPCARAPWEYIEIAGNWLEASRNLFEETQQQLQKNIEMDLPGYDPLSEARDMSDAVEVIQWYRHFIYVKMNRALRGLFRSDEDDFETNNANGSAKVALEAIDCSISAWGRMLEHFPEQEDNLLPILVELQRLRTMVENTFPSARAFMRAALD